MPVYAATSPAFADRRLSPRALVLIVGGHAALIAAVMSSKMDIPIITKDPPLVVQPIPIPEPTPPEAAKPQPKQPQERIFTPEPFVPLPPVPGPVLEPSPVPVPQQGPIIGPAPEPLPLRPAPIAEPVRKGPRFATPADEVRPPYPASKLRLEEEATLRLALTIDARGRVTSVQPVGAADPVFLDAARRHLVTRWRYKPATEDGKPVASSTVITLRFELEG